MELLDHREIVMRLPGLIACPACGTELDHSQEAMVAFFEHPTCSRCGQVEALWHALLNGLRFKWPMLGGIAPAIIGGRGFMLRIRIDAGEIARLDFEHLGLPKAARVVGVNYTPSGNIMPVELHGNEPLRGFPRVVELYGRPIGEGPRQIAEVNVAVTWIPIDAMEGIYAESLCAAFEAYSNGRHQDIVVPANVAVEVVLERLMADFFSAAVSRQRVDDFLSDGATYSHQLNGRTGALNKCTVNAIARDWLFSFSPSLLGCCRETFSSQCSCSLQRCNSPSLPLGFDVAQKVQDGFGCLDTLAQLAAFLLDDCCLSVDCCFSNCPKDFIAPLSEAEVHGRADKAHVSSDIPLPAVNPVQAGAIRMLDEGFRETRHAETEAADGTTPVLNAPQVRDIVRLQIELEVRPNGTPPCRSRQASK